ncbi:hypothetical protein AB0I53_48835 [Saccharopolyspora sp. NPDC050389]|uniref:hypothetical protein n=1 Tax=Saccharopolyspora sp. NPDC050389 TaxID=3155516 RepID=UPI0033C6B4CC
MLAGSSTALADVPAPAVPTVQCPLPGTAPDHGVPAPSTPAQSTLPINGDSPSGAPGVLPTPDVPSGAPGVHLCVLPTPGIPSGAPGVPALPGDA